MPKRPNDLPVLGAFYGDEGGPTAGLPNSTDAHKDCPFLDAQTKEFCSLDGALCPFVGFNYRKCKKYVNNMAKGRLYSPASAQSAQSGARNRPPRLESLLEAAKKGGSVDAQAAFEKLDPDEQLAVSAANQIVNQDYGLHDQAERKRDLEDLTQQILASGVFREIENPNPKKQQTQLQRLQNSRKVAVAYAKKHLGAEQAAGVEEIYNVIHTEFQHRLKDVTDPQTRKSREVEHSDSEMEKIFHGSFKGAETLPSADSNEEPHVGPHGEPETKIGTPQKDKNKPKRVTPPPKKKYQGIIRVGGKVVATGEFDTPEARSAWAQQMRSKFSKQGKAASVSQAPSAGVDYDKLMDLIKQGQNASAGDQPQAGGGRTRHESGLAQTSSKNMRAPQFATWIDKMSKIHSKEVVDSVLGGGDGNIEANKTQLKAAARSLDKKNDVKGIAELKAWYKKKFEDFEKIEHKRALFDQEWRANLQKTRQFDPDIDKKLAAWRNDPKKLTRMAKLMDKAVRNSYELEFKNQKIGNQEVTRIIRKVSIPEITKGDLEVIRANEQMGLAAIQRQHMYGKKFGKFNTWALFVRDLLAPMLLWYTGNAKLIPAIKKLFPSAMLDQLYFAYLEDTVPTVRGQGLELSRHHKTALSQKMFSGRKKTLMKGFDQDNLLPPDRAIMHAHWGPTTKQPWRKTRKQELMNRYQQTKMRPPSSGEDWRKGFLRR